MTDQDFERQPLLNPEEDNSGISLRNIFSPMARAYKINQPFSIPVIGIVFGTYYYQECPAQEKIPIALISIAIISFLRCAVDLPTDINDIFSNGPYRPSQSCPANCLRALFDIMAMSVLIAECYWIYTIHPNTKDRTSPEYCDYFFYNVMYWGSTMALIIYIVPFIMLGPLFLTHLTKILR